MKMDELEYVESQEEQPPTMKERFLEAAGTPVSLDYFLYTCLEQEKTRSGLESEETAFEWPDLVNKTSGDDWEKAASELFSWFDSQYPHLGSDKPLDHGQLVEMLPGYTSLVHNLNHLHKQISGTVLPGRLKAGSDQNGPWAFIDASIKKHFQTYANYMIKYLDWCYTDSIAEELNLSLIPPVGRFLKVLLRGKMRSKNPRNKGGNDRSRSSGGREANNRNRDKGGKSSGPRSDGNKGYKGKHDKKPSRGGRPRRTKHPKDIEREQKVVAEAKSGIAKLKDDPAIGEILLKPQNAFLRRLQHQEISDSGFKSISAGEGDGRAVKIVLP